MRYEYRVVPDDLPLQPDSEFLRNMGVARWKLIQILPSGGKWLHYFIRPLED